MSALIGVLDGLTGYIDVSRQSFILSAATIAFNPLFWNIVARQEYHNKILTKLFSGKSQTACYALAVTIFSLGMVRDYIYKTAISEQPSHPLLTSFASQAIGAALLVAGNVLVISSTYALGITGTFLGDYFGILQEKMVTGFPFNVTGSPMYTGSTMSFVGTALVFGKPAGLLLSTWVFVVYSIALGYEDPFTSAIYAKRDQDAETELKKEE